MKRVLRSTTLILVSAGLASEALALESGAPTTSCAPIPFRSAATYPTNVRFEGMVAGDFNGDGIPDIAVSSNDTNQVVVLLANPDGSFQQGIPTPVSDGESMAAGYFNGDPYLDLVVGYSTLYVLTGNGDGTFQPPVPLDLGVNGQGQHPVVADFNGDGKADIAVFSTSAPDILVQLGNGDGTFQPPVSSPTGLPQAFQFYNAVAGDLNHDGKSDVVVSGYPPTGVMVLVGSGDGHFQTPIPVAFEGGASGMVIADFTGDGNADLVAASGDLFVFAGDGAGNLAAPTEVPIAQGLAASSLAVIESSQGPVVAATTYTGIPGTTGYVVLLVPDGMGGLKLDQAYAAGGAPVVTAAFGGSIPGLAVPSLGGMGVSILYGRPSGEFAAAPASQFSISSTLSMTSGDFDEDGFPDVVAGSYDFSSSADLFVLPGTGDGHFTSGYVGTYDQRLESLTPGDFNEDGHLDLLVLGELNGLFLLFGGGDGTFGPPTPANTGTASIPVVTRFNPQSHLDLILTARDFNGEPYLVTFTGHGDGTFSQAATASLAPSAGAMAAGNFDGDGNADFAYMANDGLRIKLGAGDGTFGADIISPGGPVSALFVADVDADGKMDLLGTSGDGTVVVFYGAGDGTFEAVTYGVGWPGVAAAAGDFDGDGIPDIVVSSNDTQSPSLVAFLRGLGQRRFASPVPVPAGPAPGLMAVADLDADGRPDVVVSSRIGFVALMSVVRSAMVDDTSAVVGSPAALSVHGSGFGSLTYQWRKGGVALSDGGTISGAQTATLTISPVSFSDAGSYDVLVSDSCGQSTSNPATLSVEFADVPVSSPFHADILTIAEAGITSGCGGGNYCPTSPVRRDQLAVFLLKSEHGASYAPPACSGVFADVPCPSPFADWVERLAAEGVTSGCGGGNYCPSASVTRAQMAVFLLKTKNGSAYVPPPAVGIFGDVPVGSFAADFIEALYNQGITGGCQASPLLYCPGNAVLRQQMAPFLVRTFAP